MALDAGLWLNLLIVAAAMGVLLLNLRIQRSVADVVKSVERSGPVAERWTQAIELLAQGGGDGPATIERRLAATYAIEQVARESELYRTPSMELLAAFVREYARAGNTGLQPTTEVQSVLTILGRSSVDGLDLRRTALWGADLESASLTGVNLSQARLRGASLAGASLTQARLREVNLAEADLVGADLSGTILRGASLAAADLSGARLRGADLQGADLSRARLRGADLRDASLVGARLTGATLDDADLTGAILAGADLTSATLNGTILAGDQPLATSRISSTPAPVRR
ncbi:MAG: pentapeptide repeat-containing protein [Chloroflexi bacterium]|nr:pentapeptide repeat-containing protein [Chloroflexota bacterium]